MGNKTLIYKEKVKHNLSESYKHLKRLSDAFLQLEKDYNLPLDENSYQLIVDDLESLAYSDQIIYRFSKLQDCMGAKLFKSILLYQGENTDKPFLDILNQLEKMNIISVDDWFEIRDLRNEIAHDYEDDDNIAINILNTIYELKNELKMVLDKTKEYL
jgi:hypothetical protein